MEHLRETLLARARALNACNKGLRDLPATPEGLIDRWKQHIDFAIARDFPSVDFIRRNFSPSLLHRNLIYIDEHIALGDAPSGIYVVNGGCTGTLRFRSWAAATVYVRHNSRLSVIAEDFAKVFVRVYDEAEVSVCEAGDAVARVYKESAP